MLLIYTPGCIKELCNKYLLIYGCVSQGLRTTKFTNEIHLAEIDIQSGLVFPHLDWNLNQLHFAVKNLQITMQKDWIFSSYNNGGYLWKC